MTASITYLQDIAMHCERCSGLLVPIYLNHMTLEGAGADLLAWRCVSCGDVIDPVILEHRRHAGYGGRGEAGTEARALGRNPLGRAA